jgi:hypothetical protein
MYSDLCLTLEFDVSEEASIKFKIRPIASSDTPVTSPEIVITVSTTAQTPTLSYPDFEIAP